MSCQWLQVPLLSVVPVQGRYAIVLLRAGSLWIGLDWMSAATFFLNGPRELSRVELIMTIKFIVDNDKSGELWKT